MCVAIYAAKLSCACTLHVLVCYWSRHASVQMVYNGKQVVTLSNILCVASRFVSLLLKRKCGGRYSLHPNDDQFLCTCSSLPEVFGALNYC